MVRTTILFSLLVSTFAARASAQDVCADTVVCCNAAAAATHRPPTVCASLASAPPEACANARQGFARSLTMMHLPVPAACGAAPAVPGGGGGGGTDGPTPPVGPGTPPGGTPPGGSGEASPPPAPLGPEQAPVAHASSSNLACVMERDTTNAHRVLLGGMSTHFTIKCSGIPTRGNASGAGAPAPVPQRTASGTAVNVAWQPPPAGDLSPLFATAAYTAPATAPIPAEMRVTATVTVGNDTVTVFRTIHIVSRHLRLQMDAHIVNRCQAIEHGTVNVGFDLQCGQSIELTVGDDYAVHGTGGTSCGSGTLSGVQSCAPQLVRGADATSGWTFDAADGQIDPDTGILSLQLRGNRIGMPTVHFTHAADQVPHAVPLFPRPFEMGSDDGATRSFGSLTTNAIAGGTSTFTLHSH